MDASMAAPTVVLVHGGFVDGSGWQGVYALLKQDSYTVSVVQNPTLSLEDDVAVTKRALAAQQSPIILVGHSYGGAVITEAGNDPKVAALVYIAAFAPDAGESVNTLIANPPPGAPVPPILPPQDGFLLLDRAKFAASFAADVSPIWQVTCGLARRLWYQSGCVGEPPLDAKIAYRPPSSGCATIGAKRSWPVL